MKIISHSIFIPLISTLLISGLTSAVHAGYKDQGSYQDQPCGTHCNQVERRVDIQVIHKPRPAMLYIPDTGSRKRLRITYHHSYQQRRTPNVQIIDRNTPLTQERHRRVEMALPQARPLSALRNGIAQGVSRLLGRR